MLSEVTLVSFRTVFAFENGFLHSLSGGLCFLGASYLLLLMLLLLAHVTCRCSDFVRLFLDLERPEVNEQNEWNYELCGNDTLSSLPQRRFYSSTPYLILEFHTDHLQTNNTGFRGVFKFIDRGIYTAVILVILIVMLYDSEVMSNESAVVENASFFFQLLSYSVWSPTKFARLRAVFRRQHGSCLNNHLKFWREISYITIFIMYVHKNRTVARNQTMSWHVYKDVNQENRD